MPDRGSVTLLKGLPELETRVLGLESCPVELGLELYSRHAGLGHDSDSTKRGLVAEEIASAIAAVFGPCHNHPAFN